MTDKPIRICSVNYDTIIKVIGKRPDCHPYIWIGVPGSRYVAIMNSRNLQSLVKRWKKANGGKL